jgi:deoxyribodipyrimidine photolyase-related protein
MIIKVNKYAYLHHIERLMIMGNFGLLNQIDPLERYDWFMICFSDSFEWVMVPNVFGMSQYALKETDVIMMTRPYICSSNYLIKMSDYKSSEIEINDKKYKWDEIFDALYYNHINNYEDIFSKIYSTAMMTKRWREFSNERKKELIQKANFYINWLNAK